MKNKIELNVTVTDEGAKVEQQIEANAQLVKLYYAELSLLQQKISAILLKSEMEHGNSFEISGSSGPGDEK